MQPINIIPADQLDKARWDQTVLTADNGSLFAGYDYLSCMTENWSGLVVGAYEAVLPLVQKSKFGIGYLAAIPFVKQLGLIGPLCQEANQQATIQGIFKAIDGTAKYGDICFNQANEYLLAAKLNTLAQPNYELDLNRAYDLIAQGYTKVLKRRLKQIHQGGGLDIEVADAHEVINRYQEFLRTKTNLDLKDAFSRLHLFMESQFGQTHLHPYQVTKDDGSALLYGIYGKDSHRIYNFMTAVTQEGRSAHASVFALDYLIKVYAGTNPNLNLNLKLDFMGSKIPGVRSFVESFGAVNRPYYLYHFNHLPWPLRLLKK